MKKIIVGVVTAALLVTGTIFVFAQRSRDHDRAGFGHGHFGKAGMFLRGLDLTEEQKTKVKEIFDASKANVEPLMEQSRSNRTRLQALGLDGSFDQAQVEAIAAEQSTIGAKLIVEKERAKSRIFAVLNDEQKAKAAERLSKVGEKFKHRGQMGKRSTGEDL
jgi:protein CpxP